MYERVKVNTLDGYGDVLDIYEVDSYGNVYGNNGIELVKSFNSSGYYQTTLKIRGKRRWCKAFNHRLVALAFVEGRTEQHNEVYHIDGCKTNNYVDNLRWCDRKGNMENPVTVKRMQGVNGIRCYVYDFLLNYVGSFESLDSASKFIGEEIRAINVRTQCHYILSSTDLSIVLKINRKQKVSSVVVTNINTHEKLYFHSNRAARRYFDGKVNITLAIQKNWTVRGMYKVRNLNYKKLIGMLDL